MGIQSFLTDQNVTSSGVQDTMSLVFKGVQDLFKRLRENRKDDIEKALIFEITLCVFRHLSELSTSVSLVSTSAVVSELHPHFLYVLITVLMPLGDSRCAEILSRHGYHDREL